MSLPLSGRPLLIVAAVLSLVACATPTPYQPIGTGGGAGGFAEQRIERDRYRAIFAGNSLTSRQRVENYLLCRAAELTRQAGYDGFTIVQRDTARDVDTRVYPTGFGPYGGHYGYWRLYWRWYGRPYGWRAWDPWYSRTFWADEIDARQIERFEATAEIVMFDGRCDDARSFGAAQVIPNLGPAIEVPT